jgi:hypothetical protein
VSFLSRFALLVIAFLAIGGRAENYSARLPRFEKVYLVFAEEHSLDFVSGFGHAFLCFAPASAVTSDDLLLCPSVSFGVDLSARGRGLFWGEYTLQPSFELVRQNSFFQQRRLFFFELRTDPAGRERLRQELVGRIGKVYPYDFLNRNCGYYLADALQAARPDAELSPKGFYLTPRQATGLIINAMGTGGGLVVASPGLLADQALQLEPDLERRANLVAAAGSLSTVVACDDPRLKLLLLRMWEARASAEDYPKVLAAKESHLATPAGRKAAQEVQRTECVSFADPQAVWPMDQEGPDVGLGFFTGTRSGSPTGVSLRLDLGLRGRQTSPMPSNILREVRFLGFDLDWAEGKCRGELTLAEVNTVRDFSSLMGAGSSGARVFFNERTERMDSRGLGFDLWSGLAARSASAGWVGGKMHLVVDRIEGRSQAQFAPELFFLRESGDLTLEGSVLLARSSHLNWEVAMRYRLSGPGLSGALALRYESMSVTGGRLRFDWHYRY